MKSTELRIGNYVKHKIFGVCQIVALDFESICIQRTDLDIKEWFDLCDFESVPLTEDILLKCGFEKIENGWKVLDFICFKISWERLAGLTLTFENESIYISHIKHLHQLQNLYFALTNEELNIKI